MIYEDEEEDMDESYKCSEKDNKNNKNFKVQDVKIKRTKERTI